MSIKIWFIATRPWSLVMTFVSSCLAGILAYASGSFNAIYFILSMGGLLIAHMAANMANDWYDVKHGVDESETTKHRPHPLLTGQIRKTTYRKVVIILYGIGLSISLYLTWMRGLPVLLFTVLGFLLGVLYTADPVKLKHHSVGEVSVFLSFGPLMVGGAFYAIAGFFSFSAMLASVPIGLLVSLVLLANNIRDRSFDASIGISTISTGKTESQGMVYYKILLISAYLATILLIFFGILSPFTIISFYTMREAYDIAKSFSEKLPQTSDLITSQLTLHFGILLTVGEFLDLIYRILV